MRAQSVERRAKSAEGLTYRHETLARVRSELQPLIEANWKEVAVDQDTVPLNVDWPAYELLDKAGSLFFVTVRSGKELVGLAMFIILQHPHYNLRIADVDVFYVQPEYRPRAGIRLFREADKLLAAAGVQRVTYKTKLSHDVGRIFERLGYKAIERVYIKHLTPRTC
jgi:hypothetical protein